MKMELAMVCKTLLFHIDTGGNCTLEGLMSTSECVRGSMNTKARQRMELKSITRFYAETTNMAEGEWILVHADRSGSDLEIIGSIVIVERKSEFIPFFFLFLCLLLLEGRNDFEKKKRFWEKIE